MAGKIMAGEPQYPTDGANHYYDDSIDSPYWITKKSFKIKIDTIFFHRL